MTTIQEQEEIEYGFGPVLWDADPDVCCAAFQLGACVHTEGQYGEYSDEADEPAPVTSEGFKRCPCGASDPWSCICPTVDEEPF